MSALAAKCSWTPTAAWDEIGAELMGEILSDPKMADRIWNQNPTLAQRIVRWLEDMVQKLPGLCI